MASGGLDSDFERNIMSERDIADRAICDKCLNPNILWQPRRSLFRCGWCKKDYTRAQAEELKQLSDEQYKEICVHRNSVIAGARRVRKSKDLSKLTKTIGEVMKDLKT